MKKIGIVVEYNPFHNGHIYQINKIKELYPDSCIIVVMSSSFTMRGEISLLNKWQKTQVALNYGVDLVVELPVQYSTQSADTFALGAITLLNSLKIDALAFGTETNDLDKLKKIAKIQINNPEFDELVKENVKNGINYPTSVSKAITSLTSLEVTDPNDILAVSYIKAIEEINVNIELIGIKRTNNFNDLESNENIISASNIRNKYINNIDFKNSVPKETYNYLKENTFDFSLLYNILKYKIISEKDSLKDYHLIDEGITKRIYESAIKSENLEELINNIKTKRYTRLRVNRMLMSILLSNKRNTQSLEYIRILGMTTTGQKHLKTLRGKTNLPIINKFKNNFDSLTEEYKATLIYSIITGNKKLIEDEFKNHAIIKKY